MRPCYFSDYTSTYRKLSYSGVLFQDRNQIGMLLYNSPYADKGICHRAHRENKRKKLKGLCGLCG